MGRWVPNSGAGSFSCWNQTLPEGSGPGDQPLWDWAPDQEILQNKTEYWWALLQWCDVRAARLPSWLSPWPYMGLLPPQMGCWWWPVAGHSPWVPPPTGLVQPPQTWVEVMGAGVRCGLEKHKFLGWSGRYFCLCGSLHSGGSRPAFTAGHR